MKKLGKIFNTKVKLIIGVLVLITSIAFTQISQSGNVCNSVVVTIDNSLDNYFLNEEDIQNIATDNGLEPLEGREISQINLKKIETKLNDNPYIHHGQIYKDLQGNLIIAVELKRPVARIIRKNGIDSYITEVGDQMPVSEDFVSRVMLVSGLMVDTLKASMNMKEAFPDYFKMIDYIRNNEFWRMQIAEMDIDKGGKLVLIPQVTKQLIEFGTPVQREEKFRKLKIFYQEVLPREGWNKYTRVNLEYNQQIIAE